MKRLFWGKKEMCLQENRDRMLELVADWAQSGKSQKAFAQEQGIKVPTFQYWIAKKRQQQSNMAKDNGAAGGFVELQTPSAAGIRVRYPNGVEIHLPINTTLPLLKSLISL